VKAFLNPATYGFALREEIVEVGFDDGPLVRGVVERERKR
jgi:hypothetical protein